MNFEKKIINPILTLIKNNQDYLCQPENLPQLAKLGYIYNSLWYAGRCCWGYEGILKTKKGGYVCEENPKYKIEMCQPNCQKHDELIYDAWGMHILENQLPPSWAEFSKIVLGDTEYSDFEIRLRKPNKTFDEWVETLTNKQYRYSSIYPNRRAVANHLLCVIGNGYGFKNGVVVELASGADQDKDIYGFWEKAIFSPKIAKKIEKLMADPIVAQTLDAAKAHIEATRKKRKEEEQKSMPSEILRKALVGKEIITEQESFKLTFEKMLDLLKPLLKNDTEIKSNIGQPVDVFTYYPISEYSIITQFDETTHPSYIVAGKEICEEILKNRKLYLQEHPENVIFAEKYLKKHGN